MLLMKLANMSLYSWFLCCKAEKELSLFADELIPPEVLLVLIF
jgi:hypothetical protein